MFQALIQKGQGAISSALAKVLTRAAVAVPLVIAARFGIAALTARWDARVGQAA